MEKFINFVINLADEELYYHLDNGARDYFYRGGCFEFAKIVKRYIKGSEIVINRDYSHCGILFKGNIYDANGKLENTNEFSKVSEEDIEYMKERFGIPEKQYIKGNLISDYLIETIKECNIHKYIPDIEGEER